MNKESCGMYRFLVTVLLCLLANSELQVSSELAANFSSEIVSSQQTCRTEWNNVQESQRILLDNSHHGGEYRSSSLLTEKQQQMSSKSMHIHMRMRMVHRNNLMNIALCYHTQNMESAALTVYNQLRHEYPDYAYPLVNIATMQLKNGHPSSARQTIEKYLEEVGGMYGYLNRQTEMGQGEIIILDSNARMLGSPCEPKSIHVSECVSALNVLGISQSNLFEYTPSLASYKRAIDIAAEDFAHAPALENVYYNLAELYNVLGDFDKATEALLLSFRSILASARASANVRSDSTTPINPGPLIRSVLLVPSISSSLEDSIAMKQRFENKLNDLMVLIKDGGIALRSDNNLFLPPTHFHIGSKAKGRDGDEDDDVKDTAPMSKVSALTMEEVHLIPPLQSSLVDFSNKVQGTHFPLHYYGFNDRPLNELVAVVHIELSQPYFTRVSDHIYSYQPPSIADTSYSLISNKFKTENQVVTTHSNPARDKVKVVFLSCLFGGDEPHQALVVDVMKRLPSRIFELHAIGLGAKLPYENLLNAVEGKYHHVGNNEHSARTTINSLDPDCLVFVENLNDPVVHALSFARFAPIQILLMGSPVTSGVPSIDYFISGDRLEHPFRTMIQDADEPYTEQVVLLDGQAISFSDPKSQKQGNQNSIVAAGDATGTISLLNGTSTYDNNVNEQSLEFDRFGVPKINGAIYMCFQNIFKLQPIFDSVIMKILHADKNGHIVLQAARDNQKTLKVGVRIRELVEDTLCTYDSTNKHFPMQPRPCLPAQDILRRIHFIPRVMSTQVQDLYQSATVALHPFPFGGSKTAFDTFSANVPLVTFPQKYLRGRMAATFYATMALEEIDPEAAANICCVGNDISDYIVKALRLGTDQEYRKKVVSAIRSRKHRIHADTEISFEWARFLTRAMGVFVGDDELALEMGFARKSWQTKNFHDKVLRSSQARWKRTKYEKFVLSHAPL